MKFGDKLIRLRKKNGLSQEELAEKLGVSRQSVSKWESNNTYPETDKIVQICNLFNCSMDDLINEKIVDIDEVERGNKSSSSINIDSLLNFITKTIDMFAGMTFGSGLKCVVELMIIAAIMSFGGYIVINISIELIRTLLSFLGNSTTIARFIGSLLSIVWFIITVIALIHIFKIRYLDYYEEATKDKKTSNDDDKVKNGKIDLREDDAKIKHKERIKNVVIRDKDEKPFAFLSILSKLVIYFIKFCVAMFALGAIFTLFGFVACFVVLVPFSFNSMLFLGINIAVIAACSVNILLIFLLYSFIFNRKINNKICMIIFMISVIVGGIGSGVGFLGLKDIEVRSLTDSSNQSVYEEKINFSENLFIDHNGYDVMYLIDDNIASGEIVINAKYDNVLFKVEADYRSEDGMKGYFLHTYGSYNFKSIYDIFIKNLKNNVIIDYSSLEFDSIIVKANQETIGKLMNNLDKMYLYEKSNVENGFNTTNYEYKVEIVDYDCSFKYDALTDSMKIDSRYCDCERRTVETYKGTKIYYRCNYNNSEEDE